MQNLHKKYKSLHALGFHEFRNLVFRIFPEARFTHSLKNVLRTTVDRFLRKEEEYPLPQEYDFLPTMPTPAQQIRWTGNHGSVLAKFTADFMLLMFFHAHRLGLSQSSISVLDYGCGWGRMTRMLPYFTAQKEIYGVDPTQESVELCNIHKVPGTYAVIDHMPKELPWGKQFDLVYAYSVFTHMNAASALNAVRVIRKNISQDGLLCVTIRPRNYWRANVSGGKLSSTKQEELLQAYDKEGYAFLSYQENKHGGPSNWGDSTFSLNYINRNWKGWQVVRTDTADSQPYQNLVFLRPK